MSKDEIDEFEEEMHQTLERLNLDPELVHMMGALWLQQLKVEREAQRLH